MKPNHSRHITIARRLAVTAALLSLAAKTHAQQTEGGAEIRDLYSDTWVATDGLGRKVADAAEAGAPRKDRTVAMFYFLTFGPEDNHVYDNTKILKAHPEAMSDIHNPAWGPLNYSHYWGEPLFGYYLSTDEYVIRKHAQMLAAAGVDLLIVDNSNAVTYDHERNTLLKIFEQIRKEGGKTPQIAFLCPFGNPGNIGTRTLNDLYSKLYEPGLYSDLWFRWQGKPLILADPSYADANGLGAVERFPAELKKGETLGQSFTAASPFTSVGGDFPTYTRTDSGMTLSLYAGGPGGKLLARHQFTHVADNATVLLETNGELPPGKYYFEASEPVGQIGWWGYTGDVYAGGKPFEGDTPSSGGRTLTIADHAAVAHLIPDPSRPSGRAAAVSRAGVLRDFFTFRSPIAPYNETSPPPNAWAWLQVYPQAAQHDASGKVEEITVGVAQNYNATVNSTAPMSVPGAFGRSFHEGHLDSRPNAVAYGFNFAEQWQQARKVDPPFVFITGWNEWTAGFYDSWVQWHAPPPIFVDEFTEEYSRDIEPMRGGHGDNYYYQLVDNIRRYKGVRPLPPVSAASIDVAGSFDAWQQVTPEFRDAIGDTAHRDEAGVGDAGKYVNATGRNDIVAAKVSYDAKNVYFYVRTQQRLTSPAGDNWMLLFLNTDGNDRNGWLGYDFVVNRIAPKGDTAFVQRNAGGFSWGGPVSVPCHISGTEMMLSIPRTLLDVNRPNATIDFKWADNCITAKDWTDFTLNGDAAPDDRFNYRARLTGLHR